MSDLYEVEAILLSRPASAKSRKKGAVALDKLTPHEREYYIKWKGYSITESTWEPYENLKNVKTMVTEFIDHDEKLLAKNVNYKKMISNPEFACQCLTDKRMVNGKEEYLVRWSDFEQETWEDASNLPTEAIDEYEAKRNDGNDHGAGGNNGVSAVSAAAAASTVSESNSPTRKRNLYHQEMEHEIPIHHHLSQQKRSAKQEEQQHDESAYDFGGTGPMMGDEQQQEEEESRDRAKKRKLTEVEETGGAEKKRRLELSEEEERQLSVRNVLDLEREKLSLSEQAIFDLIVKHDWNVSKVLKGKVYDFDVKVSHGELTQQFPLQLFRLVHPQKVIDFFLAKTKFSSASDRQSLGGQQRVKGTTPSSTGAATTTTPTSVSTPVADELNQSTGETTTA